MPSLDGTLMRLPFFKYGVGQEQGIYQYLKRGTYVSWGQEMVPGSIFGAASHEDTSQQELCAFSFCPP